MGVTFAPTRRLTMKAPLLVAAVMFFTTAVATNGGVPSKKDGVAPNKKGGARSRDQKFPPSCTRFNTEYQYDPATDLQQIITGVQRVATCAHSCHHNTHCQYWTIFHPTAFRRGLSITTLDNHILTRSSFR